MVIVFDKVIFLIMHLIKSDNKSGIGKDNPKSSSNDNKIVLDELKEIIQVWRIVLSSSHLNQENKLRNKDIDKKQDQQKQTTKGNKQQSIETETK